MKQTCDISSGLSGRRTFVRGASLALALVLAFLGAAVPAFANSAPRYWEGSSSTGVVLADEGCPLVVEKELLRFDIDGFPDNFLFTEEARKDYSARVSAEYSFLNPTDETVTATLVFPFGKAPSYAYDRGDASGFYESEAREGYRILVNGQSAAKRLRYTYSSSIDSDFDIDAELALFADGFAEDPFFAPETAVYCLEYRMEGLDFDAYPAAFAALDLPAEESARLYCLDRAEVLQREGDFQRVGVSPRTGRVRLFIFGDAPEGEPEWTFYEDPYMRDGAEIAGTASLALRSEMSFAEFALSLRPADSPVPDTDWYNAVLGCIRSGSAESERPVLRCRLDGGLADELMRWYEYELVLGPGERLTNLVEAPLYPTMDMGYNPPLYTYTYLLSPASKWASFGELRIEIRTPYYLVGDGGLKGFEREEYGYSLTLDGLPEGELCFDLSESEKQEKDTPLLDALKLLLKQALLIFGAAVLLGIALVVTVIIVRKKKEKKRS